MDMKGILRAASSGTGFFELSGRSEKELRDFEELAKLAFEAEKRGYVYQVFVHRKPDSPLDAYDCVYVTGVTVRGLEFASEP